MTVTAVVFFVFMVSLIRILIVASKARREDYWRIVVLVLIVYLSVVTMYFTVTSEFGSAPNYGASIEKR